MGALRRTQKHTNMAVISTMTSMISIPTMVRPPISCNVSRLSWAVVVGVLVLVVSVIVVVDGISSDDDDDDRFMSGDCERVTDEVTITGIVISAIVVVADIVEERLDVSVRLGQPIDCTSVHTGETFLTVSIAVSSAVKVFCTFSKPGII